MGLALAWVVETSTVSMPVASASNNLVTLKVLRRYSPYSGSCRLFATADFDKMFGIAVLAPAVARGIWQGRLSTR
ncbi:hypothetical protein SBV1_260017 [Verrucomicrobia bacterium]|nr:hypothetical protein SBV1_260017 [Verrucomicrobiota bacterium]